MSHRRIWFERTFAPGLPVEAFPDILERLRGTPGRLAERTHGLDARLLTTRFAGAWSIQEHAGHLLDLEELWTGRIDDFVHGEPVLRPADLQNTRTEAAQHNRSRLADLLEEFRSVRRAWVEQLEEWDDADLTRTAHHPRLDQPMTVVDLAFFVAEHDDHHLAAMTAIRREHAAG